MSKSFRRVRRGVGAAAIAALCAAVPTSAAAAAPLPVTYNAGDGAAAAGRDPNSSPPGANDFGCKPSARIRARSCSSTV